MLAAVNYVVGARNEAAGKLSGGNSIIFFHTHARTRAHTPNHVVFPKENCAALLEWRREASESSRRKSNKKRKATEKAIRGYNWQKESATDAPGGGGGEEENGADNVLGRGEAAQGNALAHVVAQNGPDGRLSVYGMRDHDRR